MQVLRRASANRRLTSDHDRRLRQLSKMQSKELIIANFWNVFFLRMSTLIFVLCGSVVFTQSEQGSHPMFVLCGMHSAVAEPLRGRATSGLSAKTKRTIEGMADGGFSLVGLLLGRPCEIADRNFDLSPLHHTFQW